VGFGDFPGWRWRSFEIQGTGRPSSGSLDEMEVNHGCFDTSMAHEALDGADVSATLEEMSGKAVP